MTVPGSFAERQEFFVSRG